MANFGNVFQETEIKKVDTHPKRITKWIHYTKMVPNKKQYRDVTEQRAREEALAMLIQADGEVLQDLIVRKIDADEYEIIAGHTRHGACRLLVEEEGKTQFEFLPCIVKDISEVRAAFQVFSSNGYSEKTHYEKMHEIEEMKHLIESYPEEFPELQKGRMVEKLAKQLKIDKSTVGEYLQIANNLTDDAMGLFETGEIKKNAAVKLAGLPSEEQSQLVRSGVRMATQIEVYKKQKSSAKQNSEAASAPTQTPVQEHTVTLQDILGSFKNSTWLLTVSGVCEELEGGVIKLPQEAEYENCRNKKVKGLAIFDTENGPELMIDLE